MAKKMRTIMNPLDRSTRNDLNYNFGAIDDFMDKTGTIEIENEEELNRLDDEILKLKEEDKRIESKVDENRQIIEDLEFEKIVAQGKIAEEKGNVAKEQGIKAESQGNVAKEQGIKAESQGKKTEEQGNYAEQQGDYAKEKGEETAKATAEIKEANEDLQNIKNEAIDITQTTKEQGLKSESQGLKAEGQGNVAESQGIEAENKGNYAKEKGDEALAQTERVKPILDKADEAIIHATEQGDYAKSVGDKVLQDNEDLQGIKNEAVDATLEAIEATEQTIAATEKATDVTKETIEVTKETKERTEYLETLLPNIEGWEFLSEWSKDIDYKKHNIVTYNGSTYMLYSDAATGSPADDDGWHMLARRGIDGKGAVRTVNNLTPDLEGNVDLGELATPDDVKDAADKTLEASKEYTDAQISEIPEVDISHLETKEDATAKLEEAKTYTDEAIGDVDLSEMEKQISDHSKEIATTDKTGHVQVGKGLDVDKSGILSTKTASKEAIESGVSDDEFITPKGLSESKEEIVKSVEGLVKSVNSKKPTADGNVDLGELVHSVAGIAPNVNGDVNLKSSDVTRLDDNAYSDNVSLLNLPEGMTVFYVNRSGWSYPHQYGTVVSLIGKGVTTGFQFFVFNNLNATRRKIYYRIAYGETIGWSDWYKIIDELDKSDSTTSDSSDKVATSKAVFKLQQEISELRNAIIELGGKL